MTRARPADLALVSLLRRSLPRWLSAADLKADADDFDHMPSPTNDDACSRFAEEIGRRVEGRYAVLGIRLVAIADTPDGRRAAAAAKTIAETTGERALLDLVRDRYGLGSPPWWAAVCVVEMIPNLASRVALNTVGAARAERRLDPVADAIRVVEAFARFRGEEASRILDGSRTSRPTAGTRQPLNA
jgi:hypothetical protein